MLPIYFTQLSKIFQGKIIQNISDKPITQVFLDSRAVMNKTAGLFFALQGQHHNGHAFIDAIYAQGGRQFVVEQGNADTYRHLKEANIIQVKNGIAALQKLAWHHRKQYKLPVLAITGSNGKTMVKEWLSELLAAQHHVVKSPKSHNSQIGVPLSLLQINSTHTYGIFEAGISQPGEMAQLAAMIQPQAGIFTNIGTAHCQGFASLQQKIEEKALLFQKCAKIFYCKDHVPIDQVLQARYAHKAQLVTWSFDETPGADFYLQKQANSATGTTLTMQHGQHSSVFSLPFRDAASLENAAHCLIFLGHEGFSASFIQKAMANLPVVPMRLTLKQGIRYCQLVDDTYNNDVAGLQAAIGFMAQQNPALKKTVILSDMLQTGTAPEKLYPQIAQLLMEKGIDRCIGIGKKITAHAQAFGALGKKFYPNAAALLNDAQLHFNHELILIKGARAFGLEKIVDHLQAKIHGTVLEIDLDALAHNLRFFRSKLAQSTKIMVMVKALAYGSSSFEVANFLQYHGIDYLAVAYVDEGIVLRQHGITLPIMVMSPTPESFDKLVHYGLEAEIYSLPILKAFRNFLLQQKRTAQVHIKCDTGMHRLGFAPEEIDVLVGILQATPQLKVASVFSHLAASDMPQHDAYTHRQVKQFGELAQRLEQGLQIKTIKHLLNSSGIVRFPHAQCDMVRLGIGLYGVGVKAAKAYLETATTLKTVVLQVKNIPKGATIGYNRSGIATKAMTMATLAIGYADGFKKAFGQGNGKVWINGHFAPVVGQVCMDLTMADVTGMEVAPGDEAIIFGHAQPMAAFIDKVATTPYEVLAGISERVKRVYFTN